MTWLAIEVSFALDGAVVLAGVIGQLQPDPFSWSKGTGAYEANDALSAIGALNCLA